MKLSFFANHMKWSVFHKWSKKANKIQSFSLVLAFQKFSQWKIGSTPAAKIRTLVLLCKKSHQSQALSYFYSDFFSFSCQCYSKAGPERRSFVMLNENHSDVPNDPTEAGHWWKETALAKKPFPSLSVAALCFWTDFQHWLLSFKNIMVYFDVNKINWRQNGTYHVKKTQL